MKTGTIANKSGKKITVYSLDYNQHTYQSGLQDLVYRIENRALLNNNFLYHYRFELVYRYKKLTSLVNNFEIWFLWYPVYTYYNRGGGEYVSHLKITFSINSLQQFFKLKKRMYGKEHDNELKQKIIDIFLKKCISGSAVIIK